MAFPDVDAFEENAAYVCPDCGNILDEPNFSSVSGMITDYSCKCGVLLTVYSDGSADYVDASGMWHKDLDRDDFLVTEEEVEPLIEDCGDKDHSLGLWPSKDCRFCGSHSSPSWHIVSVEKVGDDCELSLSEKSYYCESCMDVISFYLGKSTE